MRREPGVPVSVRGSGILTWTPGPHPSYPSEFWFMPTLVSWGTVIGQPWSWMPVDQDTLAVSCLQSGEDHRHIADHNTVGQMPGDPQEGRRGQ